MSCAASNKMAMSTHPHANTHRVREAWSTAYAGCVFADSPLRVRIVVESTSREVVGEWSFVVCVERAVAKSVAFKSRLAFGGARAERQLPSEIPRPLRLLHRTTPQRTRSIFYSSRLVAGPSEHETRGLFCDENRELGAVVDRV